MNTKYNKITDLNNALDKLKEAENKFFNTFDDKCYKPGSKVKVETSFHFIAKY